ncbi:MAG: helix-turn-helix domain-containing protein [Paracoccaceae bacterium]
MPIYKELDLPKRYERYVQRILKIRVDEDQTATIPAIPTGYVYIGWIPEGRGTGQANDDRFEVQTGQIHFTGQLTTFDASYSLHGPCTQYLAKCTADGAYLLLNRDVGALKDIHEAHDAPVEGPPTDETFYKIIDSFLEGARDPVPEITEAARRIEAEDGNLSITDLATELGMNDRQFRRKFSEIVGVTPKTFAIIRRVLFTLAEISENPDMDIADVVYRAGFSDQAHLTRTFRQYLRQTPGRLVIDEDNILKNIAEGV